MPETTTTYTLPTRTPGSHRIAKMTLEFREQCAAKGGWEMRPEDRQELDAYRRRGRKTK